MSTGFEDFLGAVKTIGSHDKIARWSLTKDERALFEADSEDVIYCSSVDELRVELEVRYPSPDNRLQTITAQGWSPNELFVEDPPLYNGNSPEEAAELAKLCGAIKVKCYDLSWLDNPTFAAICASDSGSPGPSIIRHDPKTARRRTTARQRRKAKAHVSVADAQRLIGRFAELIKPFPLMQVDGSQPRRDCAQRLSGTVVVFNALRGDNAHRKLREFQEFIANWRERKEQSMREWANDAGCGNLMLDFVDWLNYECDQEFSEPTPDTGWEPIDTFKRLRQE